MSDQRINDMRAVHFPENELGQTFCYEDGQHFPCDTAHVLAALAAQTARADAADARERELVAALRQMRALVDLLPVKADALAEWDAILLARPERRS